MKVVPFNVPKTAAEAFRFQEDVSAHFYDQLHQHPELQVMLILKGEGTLVAGDYLGRFEANDLFIIGSEQPHVFRNDEAYYQKSKSKKNVHAISLYFHQQYVGDWFWNLAEMKGVRDFFKTSSRGFRVTGTTKEKLIHLILNVKNKTGLDRLQVFIELFQVLTHSRQLKSLSVTAPYVVNQPAEGKRMNAILQFTFKESNRKIYLEEVAEIAHLSTEAFCRYFKMRTQKTYTTFLNEVRVSNACRLLMNQEMSIQDVCFQSGFTNISNFNRIFKRVTGKSPSTYLHEQNLKSV
ncbi:MAG: AraC family transcriptional regulator [Bacteroidetes bacterium]|nr:AraC family transcriptional regulator [Bacteroidota bacterium]